jgi:hypothetical protein
MTLRPTPTPRAKLIRRIVAVLIVLASLVAWLVPSNLVKLIAQEDHVLLGRYSLEHFSALALLTPLLWLVALVLLLPARLDRRMALRTLTIALSILMGLVIVDIAGRLTRSPRYVQAAVSDQTDWPHDMVQGIVRSRPPNVQYEVSHIDKPRARRSYHHAPPGFPPTQILLTTDSRGFRNQTDLERYELLTLGDSFAEGSRVSDDERWPALIENTLGLPVYNLGISGASPRVYLNNFLAYAAGLEPKVALFMIYEGNDLKVHSNERPNSNARAFYDTIFRTLKASPIVLSLRRAQVERLGSINTDGPVPGDDILSWMPVAIRTGAGVNYYSFTPKRLMRLYRARSEFLASPGWTNAAEICREIVRACQRAGVRLIFVYAPSKPHVVMPLVRNHVPAGALRGFASLRKKRLPPAHEFKDELYARLDTQESVFREFCESEGIELISTTDVLRERMAQGVQVYYTYDQHWTKWGHAAVAEVIAEYLSRPTAGNAGGFRRQ